jgi:hypothetical protein
MRQIRRVNAEFYLFALVYMNINVKIRGCVSCLAVPLSATRTGDQDKDKKEEKKRKNGSTPTQLRVLTPHTFSLLHL